MQNQLSLNGEVEVTDVMNCLTTIVADIKAGKGVTQIAIDSLTGAVKVAGEVPALKNDVTTDPTGCVNSVFAGAMGIYGALKG